LVVYLQKSKVHKTAIFIDLLNLSSTFVTDYICQAQPKSMSIAEISIVAISPPIFLDVSVHVDVSTLKMTYISFYEW
jgi:hypothetical protein